ncbi:MAG: efflux RND transporter permease subunit [Vulcanimicrobiota bacterium]
MDIAETSVSRPVATWMRILIFMLLGAIAYTQLPIELLPSVVRPSIYVTTQWEGVAPEDLEVQITRPIEDAVATVPGMVSVESETSEGRSRVTVEFGPRQDMGQAALDVLQQVQRAQRSFPQDDPTLQSPEIRGFDPNSIPILVLGVTGIEDPVRLRTILEEEVKPILESAEGVGTVDVNGGLERAIMVEFDPQALLAHSLTSQDLVDALNSENRNVQAGTSYVGKQELLVRSYGWIQNVEEMRYVPVRSPNGDTVPLGTVARITDGHRDAINIRRLNGTPAGALDVQKQAEANTVSTVEAVMEKIKEVERARPELKLAAVYNQAEFVSRSVWSLQEAAILGGILAMSVVFFFLKNFRSTLVVATSIPVSIISTFGVLWWQGYTLNTMSLVGLAVATGLIVDDAVVVMENCYRKMEADGLKPREAAIEGTREILSAVISSTVTIVVVFFPLLLVPGQTGQMFEQFAAVVIVAILFSAFDALTAVPMLCSTYIQDPNTAEPPQGFWARQFERWEKWQDHWDDLYVKSLEKALVKPWRPIIGALVVTLVSLLLLPFLGYEFMPRSDTGTLRLRLNMPVGTSLEETDQAMKKAEAILAEHPAVSSFLTSVGRGSGRGGGSRDSGEAWIALLPKSERPGANTVVGQLGREFSQIPAARIVAFNMDVVSWLIRGGGGGDEIQVNIFGPDLDVLDRLSDQLITVLSAVPGLSDIRAQGGDPTPEIRWVIDRAKAVKLGLSFTDISRAIQTASDGNVASYMQADGRRAPIVVQLPKDKRQSTTELRSLVVSSEVNSDNIGTARGIQLRQVASAQTALGFPTINRLSRQRYTALESDGRDRAVSDIKRDVEAALADLDLPDGYRWDWSQDMKAEGAEFNRLAFAALLAVVLIYMVLCIQFEDLVVPLSIMLTVPLCISGVILAVFLTAVPFSIMAGVGALLLIGIAVKNGILLIENTLQARDAGMEREAALLKACPERLRPIFITAFSAILAMVPVALKGELEAPMAVAVIGGLLASTMMTLLVVPSAYLILDNFRSRYFQRIERV